MTAAAPLLVEADLAVQALTRNGLRHRRPPTLPAVLRWDGDDPWAVTLDFPNISRWVFGWELLLRAVGSTGHAGDPHGDIRIRRATAEQFEFDLSSCDGTAVLRVDAFDLTVFVAAVGPRQPSAAARAAVTFGAGLRGLLDGERP